MQLLTIGILGHYIGSLFDEIKKRPEYIIDRESGHTENNIPEIPVFQNLRGSVLAPSKRTRLNSRAFDR